MRLHDLDATRMSLTTDQRIRQSYEAQEMPRQLTAQELEQYPYQFLMCNDCGWMVTGLRDDVEAQATEHSKTHRQNIDTASQSKK